MKTDMYTVQKLQKSQTNWLILKQPILFSLRLAASLSRKEKKKVNLETSASWDFVYLHNCMGNFKGLYDLCFLQSSLPLLG